MSALAQVPMPVSTDAVRGVLALELTPGTHAEHAALARVEAAQLAELLGRDLVALAPDARKLDLVLAAAHFDPAEVLRAGWPLHRHLQALHARAPANVPPPRIIAFGADADGALPPPLHADPDLHGGQLRVLPFVLMGSAARADDAAVVAAVDARLEEALLDLGMVQADTALHAQQAFGARIEHARYLTTHDLAAMMALQYRNAGLDALWPILETAVLAPAREAWLDARPEPLLHYVDGEARIALFDPQGWQARYAPAQDDRFRLERAFAQFETRQRQFAAVLQAHGVPVTFAHCNAREDPRQALG